MNDIFVIFVKNRVYVMVLLENNFASRIKKIYKIILKLNFTTGR